MCWNIRSCVGKEDGVLIGASVGGCDVLFVGVLDGLFVGNGMGGCEDLFVTKWWCSRTCTWYF